MRLRSKRGDQAAGQHGPYGPKAPRRRRKWPRRILNLALIAAVFMLGHAFGDGRISLQRHQPVSGNLPSKLDYTEVNQVYQSLKANYDGKLTKDQLEEGLKHGLATSTKDPYTVYFTAKEAKEFND